MAAVLVLICIPIIMSVGIITDLTFSDPGSGGLLIALAVILMAVGAFYGLIRFVKMLEGPNAHQ